MSTDAHQSTAPVTIGPTETRAAPLCALLVAGSAVLFAGGCATTRSAAVSDATATPGTAPPDAIDRSLDCAAPGDEPSDDELEAVVEVYQREGRAAAEARLDALMHVSPGARGPLLLRGSILVANGEDEAAHRLYEAGLCESALDVPVLYRIAELAYERAERGANVHYGPGTITAEPRRAGDPSPEEFRAAQLARAASAIERAIDLDPRTPGAYAFLGTVETMREHHDAALRAYDRCLSVAPEASRCLLGRGHALLALGRETDALNALELAVERRPRDADAIAIYAEALRAAGESERADEQERIAAFFAYLPNYIDAAPTDVNLSAARALASNANTRGDTTRASAIDALVARRDPDADALLAAFVHHHSHDELESRAFEALVAHGAYPLVVGLLEHGESACTIREAAIALGAAHRTEAIDALLARLPSDAMPAHPMGIPEALAALGDPRAVAPLVRVLEAETSPDLDSLTSFAYEMLRGRAALALATFGPDANIDASLHRAVLGASSQFAVLRARAALAIRGDDDARAAICTEIAADDQGLLDDIVEALAAARRECGRRR